MNRDILLGKPQAKKTCVQMGIGQIAPPPSWGDRTNGPSGEAGASKAMKITPTNMKPQNLVLLGVIN